jgi:hypothetical protein
MLEKLNGKRIVFLSVNSFHFNEINGPHFVNAMQFEIILFEENPKHHIHIV